MFCPHASIFTNMPVTHKSQKKAFDLLALELWRVVSHHVDAGTQTGVFCKGNKYFQLLAHLSSPEWDSKKPV